jgi:cytochrome c5
MSQEQDKIFFRNFTLSLVFIAAMMIVFYVVAQFAGTDEAADAKMRSASVAEATAPVGQVTAVGEETEEMAEEAVADAGGEASGDVGKKVHDQVCLMCHGVPTMAEMIPQTGDAAAWEARVAKGKDTLYDHAINGFTGELGMMPPRGMGANLTDEEVKAAVDYMVSQVATEAPAAPAAATEVTSEVGKKVFDQVCLMCHGVPAMAEMIPQTGDAAAWEARIEKGMDTLYDNAINGFQGELGMMPPRGMGANLTDEEVKAAVDYIISTVK